MLIYYLFPLITFFSLVVFLLNSSYFFNCALIYRGIIWDEISLYIRFLTLFVLYVSYICAVEFWSFKLNISFGVLLVFCLMVFTRANYFWLYVAFEGSLLPILYIIIKWGSYPERSLSAFILLLYTSIFTLPFIFTLFSIYQSNFSLMLNIVLHKDVSYLLIIFAFLVFSIKLPIYGFHFWLPMAHVEAPTFGSIILAGVLLKLGGVGLVRLSFFIEFPLLRWYLMGYLSVTIVVVRIVAASQSDFKRLIAYSSVVHIMVVPLLLLSLNSLSLKSLIIAMFFSWPFFFGSFSFCRNSLWSF